MAQPTNITDALPIAGAPVNINESLPLSTLLTDSLPPAQLLLDSLPDQGGNHHPMVILRALPVTVSADGGPGLPSSTLASGGWQNNGGGAATFDRLNEHVPNDATYIWTVNNDGGVGLFECLVGNMTDPGVDVGFVVHIRARDTSPNGLTTILVNGDQNGAGPGNFSELTAALTAVFVTYDVAILAADIAAFTNFNGVRLQFANNGAAGDGAGQVQISWVWFEVPGNPIFG